MERNVLINEICWEYNYSKEKAERLVHNYEEQNKYQDLCELVRVKQDISMIVKEDV